MSTNQSNQAVKEKKNNADSKTKGKQKYRRAVKDANSKLGSSEVRAKKTRPTKGAAIRTAAAVEETKSFRRRTVTEDASQDEKKERSKKKGKICKGTGIPDMAADHHRHYPLRFCACYRINDWLRCPWRRSTNRRS